MWHPPPHPGACPPSSSASGAEPTWEEMLDSGQLDRQLHALSVGKPITHPPPAAVASQQTRGSYAPRQQQTRPRPQPQPLFPGGYASPQPLFNRPPPLMSVVPPSGVLQQRRPQGHDYSQPPPSQPLARPPQILQRAPTSTAPAQVRIQPRPLQPQFQPPQLPEASSSSPFPPQQPVVQIISNNHYESGSHTQYRPPEPKLKILKRPQSSPSNLSAQGQQRPQQLKTLRQREEEYAQARLRILGSTGDECEGEPVDSKSDSSLAAERSGSEKATSEENMMVLSGGNAIRTPRGPDGTKGFDGKKGKS